MKYDIYTDGSCFPNPGNGKFGFVKLTNETVIDEIVVCEQNTTNNRMEYKAIIAAIKSCEIHAEITVYTDSMLAVNTINNWMHKWEKRNWIKSKKKRGSSEIKNLDLVQELFYLKKTYSKLTVQWVKGHANNYWNNYVDNLVK